MCKLQCARKMIAMSKMMISSLAASEEGKSLSAAFVENDRSPDATCQAFLIGRRARMAIILIVLVLRCGWWVSSRQV